MSFASHLFILVFLPLTVLLYYRLFKTPRGKMYFLLAASLLFYSAAGWKFIPLLLGLSALTFFAAKKGWFLPGILLNLGALALFKYLNFGLETFNTLMRTLGLAYAYSRRTEAIPLFDGLKNSADDFVRYAARFNADVLAGKSPAPRNDDLCQINFDTDALVRRVEEVYELVTEEPDR